MYFWYFWGRFLSIFEQNSIIFLVEFVISCLTCLKRPRDGLKVASDGFLEVTLAQLESKLAPSLLYVGLKLGPCWLSWPKLAPTWPQVGLKLAPSWRNLGANWAWELKRPSGPLQGPIFDRFWSIFDRFLMDFWSIFDRFLIDFWSIFDRRCPSLEEGRGMHFCFFSAV